MTAPKPLRKTILDPATGKKQTGTLMDVVKAEEPFVKLFLANGVSIQIKPSISEVLLLDEPGQDGKPAYNFTINMALNVLDPNDEEGN